jgi:hypothetical protein
LSNKARVKALIFASACITSALLAIAVGAFWVRSEMGNFMDLIAWHSPVEAGGWQDGGTVFVKRGYIAAWWWRSRSEYRFAAGWNLLFQRNTNPPVAEGSERPAFFGAKFRYTDSMMPGAGFGASPRQYTERYVAVSSPLLIAVLLIPPALWWFRWRRNWKMKQPGLCVVCGYDLRATPERCPECGAVPDQVRLSQSNSSAA